MHEEFWQARWAQNEIGFHQPQVNAHLQRHLDRLGLAPGARVLVPLCGKSLDMAWLASQGLRVLGVELAEKAVAAFFSEQGLVPSVTRQGAFVAYAGAGIEILCGDVFALSAEQVADCAGVYDRAALIALPPAMRQRYVAHLPAILPRSCQGLLVTLDYEQSLMDGPPFAVGETEVRALYAPGWQLETLDVQDVLDESPRFRERGLTRLEERVYRLSR